MFQADVKEPLTQAHISASLIPTEKVKAIQIHLKDAYKMITMHVCFEAKELA